MCLLPTESASRGLSARACDRRPSWLSRCMSGAPRPVQPPGRPPDFNGLINGLLTDAPVPRRLQTATSLCTVLSAPENAAFVQQAFSQLLHAFEQMLYDRAEPIRWQAPLLLGALAAAVRPNLHPFVSWLLYTAQCAV